MVFVESGMWKMEAICEWRRQSSELKLDKTAKVLSLLKRPRTSELCVILYCKDTAFTSVYRIDSRIIFSPSFYTYIYCPTAHYNVITTTSYCLHSTICALLSTPYTSTQPFTQGTPPQRHYTQCLQPILHPLRPPCPRPHPRPAPPPTPLTPHGLPTS